MVVVTSNPAVGHLDTAPRSACSAGTAIAARAAIFQTVDPAAVAALLASIARFIDDAEVEARLCSLEKGLKYLQTKS